MNPEAQPFVSIVTPVYNGEKDLEECIESVLAQTYQNWEYIIVNNCSTDRSLEIAESYAGKDNRIHVFTNTDFLTSLQNFNHSLRKISSRSKYCKIVHADDWIFPECIEKMVDLCESNPSIGIVSSYRLVNNKVESDGLPYQQEVFKGSDIARMNLMDGPYTFGSPTALLLRSDLVRSREKFYNEKYTGADGEVCLELLQECDFGFIHQVLTFYRIDDYTITGKRAALNTGLPSSIYKHKKFGRKYLSEEEYKVGLDKKIRAYYRDLGRNVSLKPNRQYWDFHRDAFKNFLEIPLSKTQVAKWAFFNLLQSALDLRQIIKKTLKKLRLF